MRAKEAARDLSAMANAVATIPFEGSFSLSAALFEAAEQVELEVENNLRAKYARLVLSMSLADAKRVLGIPASDDPSPEEVTKAYKRKALENHPDRGGDNDKMVEVNAARDVLLNASPSAADPALDEDADEEAGWDFLRSNAEELGRGGLWIPSHNMCINQTLVGSCNLWVYTILPLFASNQAYNDKYKGIVVDAKWNSTKDQWGSMSLDLAKRLYVLAKQQPTIQETVRQELRWIEQKFSIRVPDSIEAHLVKDAVKSAQRRWKGDRLRAKKKFYPLDGSKPSDMSSFGYPMGK